MFLIWSCHLVFFDCNKWSWFRTSQIKVNLFDLFQFHCMLQQFFSEMNNQNNSWVPACTGLSWVSWRISTKSKQTWIRAKKWRKVVFRRFLRLFAKYVRKLLTKKIWKRRQRFIFLARHIRDECFSQITKNRPFFYQVKFKPKVDQNFQFLLSPKIHTIRKVKFLSKNSILTTPQLFQEFFTPNFFDHFSREIREIKVVNS